MRQVISRPRAGTETQPRYVLTLSTASTPEALSMAADCDDLKGCTFFVSRSFEAGRERFRLHLGYFSSLAEAQQWLPVLRKRYPAAWAGRAPEQEMPGLRAALPVAPVLRGVQEAWTDPGLQGHPHQYPEDRIPSLQPAPSPPVLLAYPRAAEPAPPEPVREPKYFAVQLVRGPEPLNIDDVPPIPVLDQHTLYAVEGMRSGAPWYALRVGFFSDLPSAKRVALAVRGEFATVAVVPVSGEETRSALGEPPPAAGEHAGGRVPAVDAAPEQARRQTPWDATEEGREEEWVSAPATAPEPARARGTRRAPEVQLELADGEDDYPDGLPDLASGQYPVDFLREPLARLRRRVARSGPFLKLLERLGERIKGS